MWICKNCGHENLDERYFCFYCRRYKLVNLNNKRKIVGGCGLGCL